MAKPDDEEHDWHDDDPMGVWEHQGHPLRVRDLARLPDLPIEVAVYDGATASPLLSPLHVDFRGPKANPTAIVITVAMTTN